MKPNCVEDTRTWYNRISRVYDILAWRHEKIPIQAGLRLMDVQPADSILEIGVGTGHALISLAESTGAGGKVCGVDISDGMLRITKGVVERARVKDRVLPVQADARRLPFGNQVFDAVFMSFTLELFSDSDIVLVLSECRRVTRRGGALCIVSLKKTASPGIVERIYGRLHDLFPGPIDCRPIALADVLAENGFTITKKETFTLWGLPVETALCTVWNFHESIAPADE
jgi:ubiquinone/menaquinone biosynthesis C-methylase UbiE